MQPGSDPSIRPTTESSATNAPLGVVVRSIIGAEDPSEVSVTSSESLASLRGSIQTQLGAFGNALAAGALSLTAVLVAVVQVAVVMLRRKDFGRRRALGATRLLIVILILAQTLLLALVGAALGTMGSWAVLTALGDPLPTPDYSGAVAILAISVSLAAAIVPAALAARRDPIRELRVP